MMYWKEWDGNLIIAGKKKKVCESVITLDTESSNLFVFVDGRIEGFDYSKEPEYYAGAEKVGVCYIWMIGIDGVVYYGRELEELKEMIEKISAQKAKTIVWVQNLGHDIEFLRNVFDIKKVFARDMYDPMSAEINDYVTLRDTYALNHMALDNLAEAYGLEHSKKTGSMDYDKIRTPETGLTAEEMEYCEYDCLVLGDYVSMKAEEYGSLHNIPKTQTSEVRRELIKIIKSQDDVDPDSKIGNLKYKDWLKTNAKSYDDFEVYERLTMAYRGGSVLANRYKRGMIIDNVRSFDISSDYPYCMIAGRYPLTKFEACYADLENLSSRYCYLLHVRINDIRCRLQNTYLSSSKCDYDITECMLDNGRIVCASYVETWITEHDWAIICKVYDFSSAELVEAYRSVAGKLPKPVLQLVSSLYLDKQAMKPMSKVDANISRVYHGKKERLNGVYGMCVTKYVSDHVGIDGGWHVEVKGREQCEKQWNALRDCTLLPYRWGVWISAIARHIIWDVIVDNDEHVVYTDTDCVKTDVDISDYINDYNAKIRASMDEELAGLGEFEHEATYTKFVSLGAKKYCVLDNGELKITVAGVSKSKGAGALYSINDFAEDKIFDYEFCGKLNRYHNEHQPELVITDYTGKKYMSEQKYGTCLMPSRYVLHDCRQGKNVSQKGGSKYIASLL